MSPRHSTLRQEQPHKPNSFWVPRQSKPRNSTPAKSTFRKGVTLFFLPLWLVVIIILDRAIADFNRQVLSVVVRLDPARLNPIPSAEKTNQEIRRTFYVEPDKDGNLTGQISAIDISPISGLKVLLLENGKPVLPAEFTDVEGGFTLRNVPTGKTYSLVASGRGGFLAYAIHVRPKSVPFPGEAIKPGRNGDYVQFVALPRPLSIENKVQDEDEFQIEAAAILPTFLELIKIVNGHLPSNFELDNAPVADDSRPAEKELEIPGGFEYLLENGNFSGRFLLADNETRELSDLNVFLLKDDVTVHQESVDKKGEFRIEGVEQGVYGLVAAGKDGFAALSVKLVKGVEDEKSSGLHEIDEHYVNLPKNLAPAKLRIAIITNPKDIKYCRETIVGLNPWRGNPVTLYDEVMDQGVFGVPNFGDIPVSGNVSYPATGGGGFGGGAAGSIGGRERLLRRVALAAGIVAISLSGNGNGGATPPIMSPDEP